MAPLLRLTKIPADSIEERVRGLIDTVRHESHVAHASREIIAAATDHEHFNEEVSTQIANAVLRKALSCPQLSGPLATLAKELCKHVPNASDGNRNGRFKILLLNLCQNFEETLFNDAEPLGVLALTTAVSSASEELRVSCHDLAGETRFTSQLCLDTKIGAFRACVQKHCTDMCVFSVVCLTEDGSGEVEDESRLKNFSALMLKCTVQRVNGLSAGEIEASRAEKRRSRLAFMRFIGHLDIKLVMPRNATVYVMRDAIRCAWSGALPEEDVIESICELIAVTGPLLENTHSDAVTEICEAIVGMKCRSARVRILLKNIVERRQRGWP